MRKGGFINIASLERRQIGILWTRRRTGFGHFYFSANRDSVIVAVPGLFVQLRYGLSSGVSVAANPRG